ncbi:MULTISPECIES: hypothetical protein [Streptomyces]|uniref:hypothetical protein n=1 Tax=Streptomyces TaxID=1883 RepID=UPI000C410960|nr:MULTISPECIES: hypothetical protein [Streptomyces]PIB04570.1 hypothetical protein B1C81_32920 [Streptomyces sp. HG99]
MADYFAAQGLRAKYRPVPSSAAAVRQVGRCPDSVQRTRWTESWTGRRMGCGGAVLEQVAQQRHETGTSYRERGGASSQAPARRAGLAAGAFHLTE